MQSPWAGNAAAPRVQAQPQHPQEAVRQGLHRVVAGRGAGCSMRDCHGRVGDLPVARVRQEVRRHPREPVQRLKSLRWVLPCTFHTDA